ncbi:unnamed protein product [Pleuronectes platessa]|uniref:Uncharacterized protein n=1 Tax=Pleuronectes platessa TaxID=8262 RepID=A0A9N7UDY5_PLEPL|nr:unnamed protein product [Pleuronectes platessa]
MCELSGERSKYPVEGQSRPIGEVWKCDTPTLTSLCPACHLTFMLDVSSPAAAVQSAPALTPNTTHALCKVVTPKTLEGEEKMGDYRTVVRHWSITHTRLGPSTAPLPFDGAPSRLGG